MACSCPGCVAFGKDDQIAELRQECAVRKEANDLLRKRIESLVRDMDEEMREHEQTVQERDDAEEALSQAFYLVTGRSPEWSNLFGHKQALEEIGDAVNGLRQLVSELRDGKCLQVIPGGFVACGEDYGGGQRQYCSEACLLRAKVSELRGRVALLEGEIATLDADIEIMMEAADKLAYPTTMGPAVLANLGAAAENEIRLRAEFMDTQRKRTRTWKRAEAIADNAPEGETHG